MGEPEVKEDVGLGEGRRISEPSPHFIEGGFHGSHASLVPALGCQARDAVSITRRISSASRRRGRFERTGVSVDPLQGFAVQRLGACHLALLGGNETGCGQLTERFTGNRL